MNLKCVHCEKDAEYLVKGTSYCKEHLTEHKSEKLPTDKGLDTLESEVNRAIKESCASLIKFDFMNKGDCAIIQKLAEFKLVELERLVNQVILLIGTGIGVISLPSAVSSISYVLTGVQSSIATYIAAILYFFGAFAIISGVLFGFRIPIWKPKKHTIIKEIILSAEKRIQTLDNNGDD